VLRQRDFRLFFIGQSVSLFGDGMNRVALAFAVLSVGGSASEVGLVLAARTLPEVACLLVGGVVADRTSRRGLMVAADIARLASQGTMAALLIAGSADVWSLAVLAGVAGAASGFFNPASTGLMTAVVVPADLQRANGLRATSMGAGEVAGPIVAGLIVASSGAGWALAVDAATFGVSALFLARLRVDGRALASGAPSTFLADLREGWREFHARTWVWAFVLALGVSNMVWGAWSALGPVVADRDLGGAAAWGTVLAAMGVGGLVGALWSIRVEPRRPLVVVALTGLVFALPLVLLAVPAPVALISAGALITGFAMMLGNTVWESTLQRNIPGESLGRVSAYDWFGSLAFRPLGLVIWGPLSVAIGVGTTLWIAAGLMAVVAAIVLVLPGTWTVTNARSGPAPRARRATAAK
jgi:predicted MFS family arabinose efflux permease